MLITTEKGGLVVFDYVVIAIAIIFNLFALQGTLRSKFSLQGYRRFLLSLIASDIFICIIRLLIYLNQALAEEYGDRPSANTIHNCASSILRSLLTLGLFNNLLNLCAMSIDHFIAIAHPMRYQYIMAKGIAKRSVFIVWIVSICFAFGDIFVSTAVYYSHPNLEANALMHHQQTFSNLSLQNPSISSLNCTAIFASMPSTTTTRQPVASFQQNVKVQLPSKPSKRYGFPKSTTSIKNLKRKHSSSKSTLVVQQLQRTGSAKYKHKSKTTGGFQNPPSEQAFVSMEGNDTLAANAFAMGNLLLTDFGPSEWIELDNFINNQLIGEINKIREYELCMTLYQQNGTRMNDANMATSSLSSADLRSHGTPAAMTDVENVISNQEQFHSDHSGLWMFVNTNKIWNEAILVVWALFSFIILSICYIKSYASLSCATANMDKAHRSIRKLVVTTWLLLGAFALTWLPLMLYEMAMFIFAIFVKRSLFDSVTYYYIQDVLNKIFICNPLVDIIIYVVRVTPVQRALKEVYGNCRFCYCVPKHKRHPTLRYFIYRVTQTFRNDGSFSQILLVRETRRVRSFIDRRDYEKREALFARDLRCCKSIEIALREELKSTRDQGSSISGTGAYYSSSTSRVSADVLKLQVDQNPQQASITASPAKCTKVRERDEGDDDVFVEIDPNTMDEHLHTSM